MSIKRHEPGKLLSAAVEHNGLVGSSVHNLFILATQMSYISRVVSILIQS